MVESGTRKRELGNEDENDMEDTSGYEKSGTWLATLFIEDLVSVLLPTRAGFVPAILQIVYRLRRAILSSPSFT